MHKNNKAFTIVEVLAVVVIIAILAGVTIPGISKYVSNSKERYDDSLNDQALVAGKDFYTDHKSRIPNSNSTKMTDVVTFKELASLKYLSKNFVDSDGRDCMADSFVIVKNDGSGPKYISCLICEGFPHYREGSTCGKYVSDNGSGKDYDSIIKNVSCSINGNPFYDTGDKKYKIKLNRSGEIDHFIVSNGGKSSEFTGSPVNISYGISNIYAVAGNNKQSCGIVTLSRSTNKGELRATMYLLTDELYNIAKSRSLSSKELSGLKKYTGHWTNKNIYVKLVYDSSDFDKVSYEYNGKNFNVGKSKYFVIDAIKANEGKDKSLKITGVSDSVNTVVDLSTSIDVTKPVVSVSSSPNSWTNGDVTVSSSSSDSLSGVSNTYYSYQDTKNWSSVGTGASNSKKYSINANDSVDTKAYVRTLDNAGNYSDVVSAPVKIDKIRPNSPYVYNVVNEKNISAMRNNCSTKTNKRADSECQVCILFPYGVAYSFSAKRTFYDFGVSSGIRLKSGSSDYYQENTWTHNGNAPQYSSWTVPNGWSWRATNKHYLSYININFGIRTFDKAGNVSYSTIVHYYIYDSKKTSSYNSCVNRYGL